MAKEKTENQSFDFKIEELKNKITSVREEIEKVTGWLEKENKLITLHRSQAKRYTDSLKSLSIKEKCFRLDLIDLIAGEKGVDCNQLFEETIASIINNLPKTDSVNSVDGAIAPSTPEDDSLVKSSDVDTKKDSVGSDGKNSSSHIKTSKSQKEDNSQPKDNISPLEKARAEFAKKNPNGFAAAERSKMI